MSDGLHYARLDRVLNHAAGKIAKGLGRKKDTWLAERLVEWGGDFVAPPPVPDDRDLVDLRLIIDDEVWSHIVAKARHEGRDVTRVLHELVMKEVP